jgi:hypothetical protein
MLYNGAVSLYKFIFGAVLGAELTAKQGVIFGYLAHLMMVVPDATIDTLMDFMEEPDAVRPYLPKLDDPVTKRFFDRQFGSWPKFVKPRRSGIIAEAIVSPRLGWHPSLIQEGPRCC